MVLQTNKLIGIALLILALSVGYYFILYLPAKDKQLQTQQTLKDDQQNSQQCAESGQKYFDANFSVYENPGPQLILTGPYFHFNKKIRACFLEYKLMVFDGVSGYLQSGAENNYQSDNYIINLLSGNTVSATYFFKNGKFINDWNQSEASRFVKQERDLMQN